MTSILFLVFYNFLYYLGFGLFNVYLKYKKKDLSKEYFISGSVKINTFFPLFALFFIGNSVFILNFSSRFWRTRFGARMKAGFQLVVNLSMETHV